jgi:hypothetical protein
MSALPFPARAPRVPIPPQVKAWREERRAAQIAETKEKIERKRDLKWDAYKARDFETEDVHRKAIHYLEDQLKKLEKTP